MSGSQIFKPSGRIVCHFSCGAASAVATKMAIQKYDDVEIYYCDTGSEHDDNERFKSECEAWFGKKIKVLKNEKYKNIYEVFEARKFLSGKNGAPCTSLLKRELANSIYEPGDTEVFGYTSEENHRVQRWKSNNPERIIECPLIENNYLKEDCFGVLDRVGIKLPEMYQLGFRNNNCIGCVKAQSIDYWKRVRKHFPYQFNKTAKLEREFNYAINRITKNKKKIQVFLDEIEPGEPKNQDPNITCGLFCMTDF